MRLRLPTLLLLGALLFPVSALAIKAGQTAPDFLLEDVRTSESISLADQAGKAVVLVFFEPT
jgi:hypothetical protein